MCEVKSKISLKLLMKCLQKRSEKFIIICKIVFAKKEVLNFKILLSFVNS